ncbi:LacI family DNA-binding transcriptional regulator [Demequina mangrovi]|uniref:Transcriptional regulator, LacI family n=1 Tax=Demequina mangrovi TaxID=1043493 RepID=A0A1H7AB94_9MICO|nr:LacI family DNA-binding transcriptional regulator [Demequina mangrovi]SEJ62889.1 transcriptional regulator, LacI family [Demequina mangrovi]
MTKLRGRRPTIDDVATEAGVSRGTVSRVLNGSHWVSETARIQVEKAIKSTGYRINPHARSLATSRTGSVGFLLTESYERFFSDPNFLHILRSCADALAEHGMTLVLIMADTLEERRRATEYLTGGHVDGALVVSAHRDGQEFMAALLEARLPVISAGIPLGFEEQVGYVTADDDGGARAILELLLARGRTRIAHIAGPQDTSGGTGRLAAFRTVLGDDFSDERVVYGDYSRESGARAMRELLAREVSFDAIFAGNDLMAAGAMDVLEEAGIQVPDDVAVVGFDDAPAACETVPQLTTVRQPFDRVSEEMVRLLVDEINGRPAGRVVIPTEIVERGTV